MLCNILKDLFSFSNSSSFWPTGEGLPRHALSTRNLSLPSIVLCHICVQSTRALFFCRRTACRCLEPFSVYCHELTCTTLVSPRQVCCCLQKDCRQMHPAWKLAFTGYFATTFSLATSQLQHSLITTERPKNASCPHHCQKLRISDTLQSASRYCSSQNLTIKPRIYRLKVECNSSSGVHDWSHRHSV